jgi:hypothetical protein
MKKSIVLLLIATVLLAACGAKPTQTPVAPAPIKAVLPTATVRPPTATPTEAPPTASPEPSPTATSNITLFPTVSFSASTVCRLGPDENYFKVVTFTTGQTTQVQGRSEDSAWLIVLSQAKNKSFTCWIPVASVEKLDNVGALNVSIAPPLPVGPSSATSSAGICGRNAVNKPVTIYWSPVVDGGGYYVYRNGENHATVFGGYYNDYNVPKEKNPYVLTYGIQAFNSVGLSKVTASVSVTMCK